MKKAFLLFIGLVCCAGCVLKNTLYTPSQAEKKFTEFCLKEGKLTVFTRQSGRTEWIFVPLQEPLFELKVNSHHENTVKKITPLSLLSLESDFTDRTFTFRFDTVADVIPPDPTDYGSAYTESYIKKRQLIYQAIQESFFNLNKDPETKAAAPEFFVLVIADITKGLATKNTIYLEDVKAYTTGALPPEEYYLREQTSIIGDETLINDKQGKNLDYAQVHWPQFLTDQIKSRVRFKFSQSNFPPKSDPVLEIATIAVNTLLIYPFQDYDRVTTADRRKKEEISYTKNDFDELREKPIWQKDAGKMQVIHFDPRGLQTGNTDSLFSDQAEKERSTDKTQP